jgi:ATP-binding cassette subfamily B protein
MNWKLALITFAVLPVIVIATKIFRDKVRDSYRRIRTAIARINSYLQEHVSGMVVLQLFNRERKAHDRFSEINRSHMDAYKDAILAYALYYPVVDFLSTVAIACVLWFGGQDLLRMSASSRIPADLGRHTLLSFPMAATTASLGVVIAFTAYAQRFFRPIMDFSEKYNILQSAMAASERIFKLIDTPIDIVSPAVTKKPEGPGRIEFDHVWFAYRDMPDESSNPRVTTADVGTDALVRPAGRREAGSATTPTPDWVLRDVTFTIDPGETIAVVGHTGAARDHLLFHEGLPGLAGVQPRARRGLILPCHARTAHVGRR